MNEIANMTDIISQSFTQYAGAVIQSRALTDVRDCVKPSARQIYYCLYTDGFTSNKPFKKTLKAIGSAMRTYIHGDSSCEGVIMRSGQPFAMRYPLVEVEGSYGTQMETENWAASRYTSSRLSPIANYLLDETKQYAIDEWADNYDNTEKYPRVLSSLGFYNIVNGSSGIAVGVSSSIPQFNIKEVNDALITLIENPDAEFDDIYCAPDFATGGVIINESEVKESLKKGKGKACCVQSVIQKDNKNHVLIVKELPYGVYTNTICKEIDEFVQKNPDCGIVDINDLTGEDVCIKIYLSPRTKVDDIIALLYQNTSLQKSIGINMLMLKDGRFPQIFGWKEALVEHLNHEKKVYINVYRHRLEQLLYKQKIDKAIILAIQNIDTVIQKIRDSNSSSEALDNLKKLLPIDNDQAQAILKIQLNKLAKLEESNYVNDLEKIETEISRIQNILGSEELLDEEIIKRLKEVSDKFGDERRTKIIDKADSKVVNKKVSYPVAVSLDAFGYLKKVKINGGQNLTKMKTTVSDNLVNLYSSFGKMYRIKLDRISECGQSDKGTALGAILNLASGERILAFSINNVDEKCIFVSKLGKIKLMHSKLVDSNTQNLKGIQVMKLAENDELIGIKTTTDDIDIGVVTNSDFGMRINSNKLTESGKASSGRILIKLKDGEEVVKVSYGNSVSTIPQCNFGTRGKRLTKKQ